MTRLTILSVLLLLSGCHPPAPPAPVRDGAARRIVSLDYCADQYVLKLVPRDRILALSSDATRDFSYLRAEAKGIRQVPPRAEDVLLLHPDLVVRSYGGGPGIAGKLASLNIPVVQIGYADDLSGVRRVMANAARDLGQPQRGAAALAEFDRRMAALPGKAGGHTALYTTPGGVTGGPGTMVDSMLNAAGYRNYEQQPGWRPLPLEQLAYRRPDLIVAARFGPAGAETERWSAARHPMVSRASATTPLVRIDGAVTACDAWFILDAVEAIAHQGRR